MMRFAAWATAAVLLPAALAAQGSNEPIEIVVQWGEEVRVVQVDYSGGPRYPHLEAVPGKPDTLSAVLAPRAKKL